MFGAPGWEPALTVGDGCGVPSGRLHPFLRVVGASACVLALTLGVVVAVDQGASKIPTSSPRPQPTYSEAELDAARRVVESRDDELARRGVRVNMVYVDAPWHVVVRVESHAGIARRVLSDLDGKVQVEAGYTNSQPGRWGMR